MTAQRFYKVTGPNGEAVWSGHGTWPLPTDTEPGEWWEVEGELEACRNGLHICTADQLVTWLRDGGVIWRAEVEGEALDAGGKYVARKVRLLPGPIPCEGVASYEGAGPDSPADTRALERAKAREAATGFFDRVSLPKGHVLEAKAAAASVERIEARAATAKIRARIDRKREKRAQERLQKLYTLLGEDVAA